MKARFFDDFSDEEFSKQIWSWHKPWGNVDHKSMFTEWENVEFTDDGLRFFHTDHPFDKMFKNSGMIMMQNLVGVDYAIERPSYQYGRFSAEITVPRGTHAAFWLLSEVRIRDGIRSILPEVDIAEFGLEDFPSKLNQAIHYWDRSWKIDRKTDADDYRYKKQDHKTFAWPEGRHLYSVDIGKVFTRFYIDDELSFFTLSRDSGSYMIPLFTHTMTDWSLGEDVILHNVMIEQ